MNNNLEQVFVSRIQDNNIFHILYDLVMYYDPSYTTVYIYYDEHHRDDSNINNPCQKWRKFLLERIFNTNVRYTNNLFLYNQPIRSPFNHTHYIKYDSDPILLQMLKNVIPAENGKYILMNQRKENNRYIYDTHSNIPIHMFLEKYKESFHLPYRYCCFDDMTPQEQYDTCSGAALFISAHGAACTNMIFMPISTPIIEINFRKHWYCDPVCDNHFHNKISFDTKCDGPLIHKDYHKADFHNLSHLLGKKYYEITPDKYSGNFRDKNPISKENIHINGEYLIKLINRITNSGY
jgi:hypothetical protein